MGIIVDVAGKTGTVSTGLIGDPGEIEMEWVGIGLMS
jgi:hypothetical protein